MSVDVRREVDGQTDKECTRREMDKGVDAWLIGCPSGSCHLKRHSHMCQERPLAPQPSGSFLLL